MAIFLNCGHLDKNENVKKRNLPVCMCTSKAYRQEVK